MAKSSEILEMLIPTGGWATTGDDWEGVQFVEATPITKEEFDAGIIKYDTWKAKQEAKVAKDKADLLAKLGITQEEASLLLS